MASRKLLPVVLLLGLTSCAAIREFGTTVKTAVCSTEEAISTGVGTVAGLFGLPGNIIGAVVSGGLKIVCGGVNLGVSVATDPASVPAAAVEGVEGVVNAVAKPFKSEPEPEQ